MISPSYYTSDTIKRKLSHLSRLGLPTDIKGRIRSRLFSDIVFDAAANIEEARMAFPLFAYFGTRSLLGALAVFLFVFGAMSGARVANSARPGDFLFPVDKAIERVQLAVTTQTAKRAEVAAEIVVERIQELKQITEEITEAEKNVAPEPSPTPAVSATPPALSSIAALKETPKPTVTASSTVAITPTPVKEQSVEVKQAKENLQKAAEETKAALEEALAMAERAKEDVPDSTPEEQEAVVGKALTPIVKEAEASLQAVKQAKETLQKDTGSAPVIEAVEKTLEEKIVKKSVETPSPSPTPPPTTPTPAASTVRPKVSTPTPLVTPSVLPSRLPTPSPVRTVLPTPSIDVLINTQADITVSL